jgi:hypothetical protein
MKRHEATVHSRISRRKFLNQSGITIGAAATGAIAWKESSAQAAVSASIQKTRRPRVAAIFTEMQFRSHAYDILENFFKPYYFSGQLVDPGVDVVSFYADQFPAGDMARDAARRLNVPMFNTIGKAMTLGGKELAVDAVLSIGEHGDYPTNNRGQKMYPRKQFFDEELAVMKQSSRFVPIFNDKHLSYRWDWAKEMYDTARKYGFPLMAGSSVPLGQRVPPLELPQNAEIEEAVSIHGGGMESYDFHALEVLQSMVESRKGGESGISRVELLHGDELDRAGKQGRWSKDLLEAAMQAEKNIDPERQKWPVVRKTSKPKAKSRPKTTFQQPKGPHGILLTYKDGFRATVLKVGSSSNRWNFACRLKGEKTPRATSYYNGPWGNRCFFKALSHAIQHMFVHRKESYPIERTLLVTGVLDAAMQSYEQQGKPIQTPHLELAYKPIDFRALRENGATWKIITKDVPQPAGFEPGDAKLTSE